VTLALSSLAFADGGVIPTHYGCDAAGGADSSPPLQWSGAPAGTRSFALVCADPDAPSGTFYHWAVYDIPAPATSLPEHYPTETRDHVRQALNDFGRRGYGGPCPPPGPPHHYRFTLYALKVAHLSLHASPHCADVEAAARRNSLAQADLTGLFGR